MSTRAVALIHGVYYIGGSVWPLLSMRSFERVTGPKTDRWLVRTVALMMGALGVVLVRSARRAEPSADLACAAASHAFVIASVDAYYSARGRISKVYLLDAVAEAALVYAWARSRSHVNHPSSGFSHEAIERVEAEDHSQNEA